MSRIRQQVFIVALMVAFTAAYSAMTPLSLGQTIQRRASYRGQQLVRRTRRRLVRARVRMARRLEQLRSA